VPKCIYISTLYFEKIRIMFSSPLELEVLLNYSSVQVYRVLSATPYHFCHTILSYHFCWELPVPIPLKIESQLTFAKLCSIGVDIHKNNYYVYVNQRQFSSHATVPGTDHNTNFGFVTSHSLYVAYLTNDFDVQSFEINIVNSVSQFMSLKIYTVIYSKTNIVDHWQKVQSRNRFSKYINLVLCCHCCWFLHSFLVWRSDKFGIIKANYRTVSDATCKKFS